VGFLTADEDPLEALELPRDSGGRALGCKQQELKVHAQNLGCSTYSS